MPAILRAAPCFGAPLHCDDSCTSMPHVNMPWRRTVTELIDSEDESWLNQPKFKLSESDSDSGDFDSGVGVAYVEAVAALKKVKHVAALKPKRVVSPSCHSIACCSAGHTLQLQGQLVTKAGHAEFTGVPTTEPVFQCIAALKYSVQRSCVICTCTSCYPALPFYCHYILCWRLAITYQVIRHVCSTIYAVYTCLLRFCVLIAEADVAHIKVIIP